MRIHGSVIVAGLGLVGFLLAPAWGQTCCTGVDKFKSRFTPFCPDRGTLLSNTRPHFCFQDSCPTNACPGNWEACPGTPGACTPDLGDLCTPGLCSSSTPTTTTTLPLSRDLDQYGLLAMTHMNTTDSKMSGYTPGGGCHIGVNCALQGTEGPIGVLIMNKVWVPEGTQVAGWKTRFRVRGCPPAHVDQLFSNDVPGADRCNLCLGDPPALAGVPLKTDFNQLAPDCACRTAGKAPWPRRSGNAFRRTRAPYDGSAVIRDGDLVAPPNLDPANVANNTAGDTCDNCGVVDPQYFDDYWEVMIAGINPPVTVAGSFPPLGCGGLNALCTQNGHQGDAAISTDCAKQMLDAACAMSDAPGDECAVTVSGGENNPPDPNNPCRVDPDGPGPLRSCTKVVVDGTGSQVEYLKPGVYRQVKVQNGTLKIREKGRYVICDLVVDKNKAIELEAPATGPFTAADKVTVFVRTVNVGSSAKVFWKDPGYTFNGTPLVPVEPCEHVRIAAFEGSATSSDVLNFSKSAKVQATIYAPKRDVAFGENTFFRGRIIADDIASDFASYSCCKSGPPPNGPDGKNCVANFECLPGWWCVQGRVPSDDPGQVLESGYCEKLCTLPPDTSNPCATNDTCRDGDTTDGATVRTCAGSRVP